MYRCTTNGTFFGIWFHLEITRIPDPLADAGYTKFTIQLQVDWVTENATGTHFGFRENFKNYLDTPIITISRSRIRHNII